MTTALPRLLAGLLLSACLSLAAHAESTPTHWIATWGAGPGGPIASKDHNVDNQTLRLIVHTSTAGHRVRVRVSNELGTAPLRLGAAHLALRAADSDIVAGSDRVLRFGGQTSATLAPGAAVLSDPVDLDVPALGDLAVSLYFPGATGQATVHTIASQTGYVSPAGDFSGAASLPVERKITAWPFLTEVDVEGSGATIVAFGDSITDGFRSRRDSNDRWPDWLARRLQAAQGTNAALGVVNRGISGNRLLEDARPGSSYGPSILHRFEHDVLATSGVRWMTLLIGINDIAGAPPANPRTAEELIAGYREVIARAHAAGIAVFGATLTPFEGASAYSAEREAVRQAVNTWIRTGGAFDGVIDFDRVTRDPAQPTRFLPEYDCGDHLHPNDKGYEAMGNAVPLDLFRPMTTAK